MKVPVELTSWPTDRAERVGVNSFGIGGANAHVSLGELLFGDHTDAYFKVLLESARSEGFFDLRSQTDTSDDLPYLLNFSAHTADALKSVVQSHEEYLKAHPESLHDLSYTLNVRREPLPYRAYSVVSKSSMVQPLKVSTFERNTGQYQLVYVFTGQGAQWARMGASLLEGNPVFRKTIQDLEVELSKLEPAPSWSLTGKSNSHLYPKLLRC